MGKSFIFDNNILNIDKVFSDTQCLTIKFNYESKDYQLSKMPDCGTGSGIPFKFTDLKLQDFTQKCSGVDLTDCTKMCSTLDGVLIIQESQRLCYTLKVIKISYSGR